MNFYLSSIEAFDSSTDLVEYNPAFYTHMSLYDTSNVLICRAFPKTLRGPTREWYTYLKLLSIGSFGQLINEFKLYFLRNIRPRSSVVMLFKLK